jgi:hypothetical protein
MTADVNIKRWTGASGGPTKTNIDGTNTVANAQDAHEVTASSSSNPIKIPGAGTNHSYWVCTRLATGATGPSGTINNIRWYGDGSADFGTGVSCNVGQATAYRQATGTAGEDGTDLNTTNYTELTAAPVNFTTKTSGSPFSITGSTTTNSVDFGNFVVYQLAVATTASPGTTNKETFTWLYDET